MDKVIKVRFGDDKIINTQNIKIPRVVNERVLSPAVEKFDTDIVDEHKADPIKSIEDIRMISRYLIDQERYRDNMLFIVGINFGLRVSDLIRLRFATLINEDLTFKTTFPILEIKTRNTRKVKKNRYITINDAVMDAVILYLNNSPSSLSDYMFRSESNRGKNQNNPLSRKSVDRILKGIAGDLHLDAHVSTHTLRKTFGYHQMLMSNNDPRKLLLLQKIFGHSSVAQTLEYIGITEEEIADAYQELNLGLNSKREHILDSILEEVDYA